MTWSDLLFRWKFWRAMRRKRFRDPRVVQGRRRFVTNTTKAMGALGLTRLRIDPEIMGRTLEPPPPAPIREPVQGELRDRMIFRELFQQADHDLAPLSQDAIDGIRKAALEKSELEADAEGYISGEEDQELGAGEYTDSRVDVAAELAALEADHHATDMDEDPEELTRRREAAYERERRRLASEIPPGEREELDRLLGRQ